jgi:hydrogenase nickel incorporation protein HypA/HybF
MHELSLCRSIYGIVERAAAGRPVEVIHLQVGRLRQVVPDTLRHCWELVADSTPLAGSVLDVESMPAIISCDRCAEQSPLAEELIVLCASCGAPDVRVIGGEEFLLTSLDLASV